MLKLYKRIDGVLHYHEAWVSGSKIIEHWGVVGQRGQTGEHELHNNADPEIAVSDSLQKAINQGYVAIDGIGEATLIIEYAVDGMGGPEDLQKRYALEDRMNELLGWTGLGVCDGGSIGSGTIEVCCFVADFEIAKRVIENDLAGTCFANFTRIYDDNGERDSTVDSEDL